MLVLVDRVKKWLELSQPWCVKKSWKSSWNRETGIFLFNSITIHLGKLTKPNNLLAKIWDPGKIAINDREQKLIPPCVDWAEEIPKLRAYFCEQRDNGRMLASGISPKLPQMPTPWAFSAHRRRLLLPASNLFTKEFFTPYLFTKELQPRCISEPPAGTLCWALYKMIFYKTSFSAIQPLMFIWKNCRNYLIAYGFDDETWMCKAGLLENLDTAIQAW